jgi:hypothetical protein
MPDSLYERDVLAWSQHQADRLRRPWPGANPFTLDQLMNGDSDDLLRHLWAADPSGGPSRIAAAPP